MQKHSTLNNWVNIYTEQLLSRAMHKLSNSENAKDIVQDTFLAAAQNFKNFKNESNPKTWLFSILNNKISDFYRKRYRQDTKLDFDVFSAFFTSDGEWNSNNQPLNWQNQETNLLDDLEFIEILNYCIENLPNKFNTVIKMKYYSEKKSKEICQELEINTTNMWQIMHRAKLKLRDCVENGWFKRN